MTRSIADFHRQYGEALCLNLGGFTDCHPAKHYTHHLSLDVIPSTEEWSVAHDILSGFPLPDQAVRRIVSEHFFEHIPYEQVAQVINECHRILVVGGTLRIAVPDYMHPNLRALAGAKRDPRHPDHAWLPCAESFGRLLPFTKFTTYRMQTYWTQNSYVHRTLDPQLGHIRRTPEHDSRNVRLTLVDYGLGLIRDACHVLYCLGSGQRIFLETIRGRHFRSTSLVIDFIKI